MFSLEEISKIRNAKESKEVMQFFGVLDSNVSTTNNLVGVLQPTEKMGNCREDVVCESSDNVREIIVENGPNINEGNFKL